MIEIETKITQSDGYFPIYVEELEPNQPLPFDLFIKRDNHFVLYCTANHAFNEEDLINLMLHGVQYLYVKASEQEYLRRLETKLSSIVRDERLDITTKAAVVYNVASYTVKAILEDPRAGDLVKRSKRLVENVVKFLLLRKEAFLHLLKLASHDYYLHTHSVNVCTLAVALAKRIGIRGSRELNQIGLGALLHDLGKCNVDLSILNKPGPPTEEEWKILRQHPLWGVELAVGASQKAGESNDRIALAESGLNGPAPPEESLIIIRQHHENCNGVGYPFGLTDKEIHLYAKIVRVVDIYDALTTNRSYRKALSPYQALQLMHTELVDGMDKKLLVEFVFLLGYGTK